jgi:hypothetical protein
MKWAKSSSFLIGRNRSSKVLNECNDRSPIHRQARSLAEPRSQRGTHSPFYTYPNGTTYLFTLSFCYEFFTNIFYGVPLLGPMACFLIHVQCKLERVLIGILMLVIQFAIHVQKTLCYCRLSFLLRVFRFSFVLYMCMVWHAKKSLNPYSWTYVEGKKEKNCFYFM